MMRKMTQSVYYYRMHNTKGSPAMKSVMFAVVCIVGALCWTAFNTPAYAEDRPVLHAARVPDGAIRVDGRLDDWAQVPASPEYRKTAAQASLLASYAQRAPWTGADDLSFTLLTAHDTNYLYVAASVRDQVLINEGGPDDPWIGDDFEVFIDASPPALRYADGINENCLHFTFVPQRLWNGSSETFVANVQRLPGVLAVSRLTPTGYTIEVKIPKALLPNWKTHPDLRDIGFDVMLSDNDWPGLYGHDAGGKEAMFALQPGMHFRSSEKLGTLVLDASTAAPAGKALPPDGADLPGYAFAQRLLDHFDNPQVEREIGRALRSHDISRKAALFVLARRPDLAGDTSRIIDALTAPNPLPTHWPAIDPRVYAMIALSKRGKLPTADVVRLYESSDDVVFRHTALYCLGKNADKSIIPELVRLYQASAGGNYETAKGIDHEIIACSLAELGDPTGAETLQMVIARDKTQRTGVHCAKLLKQLGSAVK